MSEERCDLTELLKRECAHCRKLAGFSGDPDDIGWSELEPPGPWFVARFSASRCSGCEEPIKEGDRIRTDGSGRYQCENCGEDNSNK